MGSVVMMEEEEEGAGIRVSRKGISRNQHHHQTPHLRFVTFLGTRHLLSAILTPPFLERFLFS